MDTITFYFGRRQTLLVIDNCEHLADECARVIQVFLSKTSDLKILTTSREPLGLEGEVIFRVPSLSFPHEEDATCRIDELATFDAVDLFVSRLRAALPGFELNESNSTAISQICRRLDGIPLAIELVACRCASLGVHQVAERLSYSFRLLASSEKKRMERHRTLRSTIEWSYQLIAEPERNLLQRLAVFIGGWTIGAAEQVCAEGKLKSEDVASLLGQLVDKSLVQVDDLDAPEPRYRMLATIQEFALEALYRCGESELIRSRQFSWILHLAELAHPYLNGPSRISWMRRLDQDTANIRSGLDWAIAGANDIQGGVRVLTAIGEQFMSMRSCKETYAWVKQAHAAIQEKGDVGLVTHINLAHLFVAMGNFYEPISTIDAWIEKGLQLCPETEPALWVERGYFLRRKGEILSNVLGKLEEGLTTLLDAETLLRKAGPDGSYELAWVLSTKSFALRFLGKTDIAEAAGDEANNLFERMGDGIICANWLLAESAIRRGDFAMAKGYSEKQKIVYGEFKNPGGVGTIQRILANWEWKRGLYSDALVHYQESIQVFHNIASVVGISLGLCGLAADLSIWARSLPEEQARKQRQVSTTILGAVQAAQDHYQLVTYFEDRQNYDLALAEMKTALDSCVFETAWQAGLSMSVDEVVSLALKTGF